MHRHLARALLATGALLIAPQLAQSQSRPPWPAGDEIGMANNLGSATWKRCAPSSQIRGRNPTSCPTCAPTPCRSRRSRRRCKENAKPTVGVPMSRHAFNADEIVSGDPGQQGTQMDALGHFAVLPQAWDGKGDFPSAGAKYYGGYTQDQVKPQPDSPLQKLGIDKVPPIVTSAVLLDAKAHLGKGKAMEAGALVTAADIEAMLKAQGLGKRGIQTGDVLYVYTGWGDHWKDPDTEKFYYTKGPGLAYDAAKYIEQKGVVLVALDNPFTDPVPDGMLQGKAAPPAGVPEGLPFSIHHHNLTVAGIHNIQNANLGALARDKVWVSCTMILPLRTQGGSGSPVRPVAIGAPGK